MPETAPFSRRVFLPWYSGPREIDPIKEGIRVNHLRLVDNGGDKAAAEAGTAVLDVEMVDGRARVVVIDDTGAQIILVEQGVIPLPPVEGVGAISVTNADSVALVTGDVVYFSGASAVKRALADGVTAGAHEARAYVKTGFAAGATGEVLPLTGVAASIRKETGYTAAAGDLVFLSAAEAGKVVKIPPSASGNYQIPMGQMVTATNLLAGRGPSVRVP